MGRCPVGSELRQVPRDIEQDIFGDHRGVLRCEGQADRDGVALSVSGFSPFFAKLIVTKSPYHVRPTDTDLETLVLVDVGSKGNSDSEELKTVFRRDVLSVGRVAGVPFRPSMKGGTWWRLISGQGKYE